MIDPTSNREDTTVTEDNFCKTDTLSYWFIQAARAHRARAGAVLAKTGLYAGQEMILMSLWNENSQTLTQLADDLCVQPATVTKMVNRMEKAGLLDRVPDPDDRRAKRINLTDTAHDLRAQTVCAFQTLEADTTRYLSAEEQATLRDLLGKVLAGLQEAEAVEKA